MSVLLHSDQVPLAEAGPGRHRSSTMVDVLESWAADRPDRVLYTFLPDADGAEPVSWTYAAVARRARTIAARLQSDRLAGTRALLLYPSGLDFVAAFLGCLYAGVTAVPAYPPDVARSSHAVATLMAIADDAKPSVVLTTSAMRETMGSLSDLGAVFPAARLLSTDDLDEAYASRWTRPARLNRDTTAFLQYTSGSTGTPKGVIVAHGNLVANEERIRAAFAITDDDVVLGWLPLFHDMGLIGLVLQPLYAGATGVLMSPHSFLKRPARWLQAISTLGATVSGAPNFAYDLCARRSTPQWRETLDLSRWSLAFNGAEPVRADTIARFSDTFADCGFRRTSFYPCYGLAESTLLVAGGTRGGGPTVTGFDEEALGRRRAVPAAAGTGRHLVAAGRTMRGHEVRIVDPDTGHRCEAGRIGEIWATGPSVARGYWNRPEVSEKTFRARVSGEADRTYLRTGDLGFFHEDVLYIAGRVKDLIIVRGRNHYCQDLEHTVEQCHPLIRPSRVAAFGVETEDGEQLVIAAETRPAAARAEVVAAVRAAIARDHDVDLHGIVLLHSGEVPKTTSGKIRRSAARAAFLDGTWTASTVLFAAADRSGTDDPTAPAGEELTDWLVRAVAARLNTRPSSVDVRRPFMEYGIDSATSVQLVGDIEAHLGCQLPATLLYDRSTIEQVATYLAGHPAPPQQTRATRRRAALRSRSSACKVTA